MDTILVANAGSSSVKFQVFAVGSGDALTREIRGQVDGIGRMPKLRAVSGDGKLLIERTYDPKLIADVPSALTAAGAWLRDDRRIDPMAVGHRVVHGGPDYDRPVRIDEAVIARLERYIPLAPLHQPHNLAPIRSILNRFPYLPQVACFDTAFHRTHSAFADYYAIPQKYYAEGIRRYGFHGLSYEYIASRLRQIAPAVARGRVIVAHLGSGASMCALKDGQSIESTLGFTALDGLPMGTRPGQLDPGVILYLISEKGMTPGAVQDMLYRDCGLKGLSGVSNDVRELEASPDARAGFAIDYFAYRIGLYAGMLAAALGGIDGFVLTAGIGEHSATVRAKVGENLKWLGIALDAEANRAGLPMISSKESRVPVYVLPTDEELMIAQHTVALLRLEPALPARVAAS